MYRIVFIVLTTLSTGILLRPDAGVSTVHAYPEYLPGTFTGGFGEQTCHNCHFDYPLNPDEGSLNVAGIPQSYEPGKMYTLSIEVNRKKLGKAGFQLTARFADSTQAGSFELDSARTEFTRASNDLQYVQHSPEGVRPTGSNTSAWNINWTAPEQDKGERIIFNIAANAANGDDSEFGDYIFTREIESNPRNSD